MSKFYLNNSNSILRLFRSLDSDDLPNSDADDTEAVIVPKSTEKRRHSVTFTDTLEIGPTPSIAHVEPQKVRRLRLEIKIALPMFRSSMRTRDFPHCPSPFWETRRRNRPWILRRFRRFRMNRLVQLFCPCQQKSVISRFLSKARTLCHVALNLCDVRYQLTVILSSYGDQNTC